MSQLFQIHSDNPQTRLIVQASEVIRNGGVIAYPTDCGYSLGCHIGDKAALDRIRKIRRWMINIISHWFVKIYQKFQIMLTLIIVFTGF